MKDIIEIAQVQRVRHGHKTDDHWVNVAENSTQNQSLKECCWHPPAYAAPDLEADSQPRLLDPRRADGDTIESLVPVTARALSPYGGIATCSAQYM